MTEYYFIQYPIVSQLLVGPGETYVKNTNLIEIMSLNAQHPTYQQAIQSLSYLRAKDKN